MSDKLRKFTVHIPQEYYDKIKVLTIVHNKPIRDIVMEAIDIFSDQPGEKREIAKLKHHVDKMKHDANQKE